MTRTFFILPIIVAANTVWAQSSTDLSNVIDRPSIFLQNRAPASDVGPMPGGTLTPPTTAIAAFVGAVRQGNLTTAFIETAGRIREVHEGDLLDGTYRIQEITLNRLQVFDGTTTRFIDMGNTLRNEPRVLTPALTPAPGTTGPRSRPARSPVTRPGINSRRGPVVQS